MRGSVPLPSWVDVCNFGKTHVKFTHSAPPSEEYESLRLTEFTKLKYLYDSKCSIRLIMLA